MMRKRIPITNSRGLKLAVENYFGKKDWHVLFLSGYGADMEGTKARFLQKEIMALDGSITLFDYTGRGNSEGIFLESHLEDWLDDAQHVFKKFCSRRTIVIGSSMGGWLAMLLAQRHPLAGMILLAPAPDFPDRLFLPTLVPEQYETLQKQGVTHLGEDPDGLQISWKFCESARAYNLLDGGAPCQIDGPLVILQGMLDRDVPWSHALLTLSRIRASNQSCILLPSEDHRLSSSTALERLRCELMRMIALLENDRGNGKAAP